MMSRFVAQSVLHAGVFALAVSAVALVSTAPLEAQKGKPVPNSTATVTFVNRVGDAMTSVGSADYPGAVLFSAAEGDLRLDIGAAGRAVQVVLGTPASVAPGEVVPDGDTFLTDAVLFIQNLRGITVGSTVTRLGRIGLGSAYPNHALGFRQTTSQGIEISGTPVCVYRASAINWTVTSSACAGDTSDTAGLFEENLKGKINHRFKATYAVPFAFDVTCTANCPE